MTDTALRPVTTITDVARAAERVAGDGVARAERHRVRCRRRGPQRVRDAADRLGYLPSGPARALRRQVNQVWAAIVADIDNPFFTAVVRGIEDVARAEDHRLVLCNSDEDVDTEAVLRRRRRRRADGRRRDRGRVAGRVGPAAPARPRHPRRRRRPPARRRARSTRSSSTTGSAPRRRPRTCSERGCDAHRVHHRPAPGRHGERAAAGLPRRARARRLPVDRALVRRADFKLDGGYRAGAFAARVGRRRPTRCSSPTSR